MLVGNNRKNADKALDQTHWDDTDSPWYCVGRHPCKQLQTPQQWKDGARATFLYRPYISYRRLLHDRKHKTGIVAMESFMPPLKLLRVETYLDYLKTDNRRQRLCMFYFTLLFLRKTWDLKKVQLVVYNYSIKVILVLEIYRKVGVVMMALRIR
jgi:hypothetical protein